MRIYCPKCHYEPPPSERWSCVPICGCSWNTFATHGICPRCKRMWRETQCPKCGMWSLHDDWYHDELDESENEKMIRELSSAN